MIFTPTLGLIPLLASTVAGQGEAAPVVVATTGDSVLLSGLLFDRYHQGESESVEAVRITATCSGVGTVDLGGLGLSSRYVGSGRGRSRSAAPRRTVWLPRDAAVGLGGDVWMARTARGFARLFGFKPDFEAEETDPEVPNLRVEGGWPRLSSLSGVLSLHAAKGRAVDLVAYDARPEADRAVRGVPAGAWSGPPVLLFGAVPGGWSGKILARDRDEAGCLLSDTSTAADWDSGFSAKALNVEPTHRFEFPGQSRFRHQPLRDQEASVVCGAAPENSYVVLTDALDSAERSIQISAYRFSSDLLADHLVAARGRGVRVSLWAEGGAAEGLGDQERYILQRLLREGVEVSLMEHGAKGGGHARYRLDHSKYLIIDEHVVIVSTENLGRAGYPPDPSFGNRGFSLLIDHPVLAQQLKAVWRADVGTPAVPDVVTLVSGKGNSPVLAPLSPSFSVDRAVPQGTHRRRRSPLQIQGQMDLALVVGPDHSLDENGALLGLIRGAESELLVVQSTVPLRWGGRTGSTESTPNLALEALLETARRGVRTRLLVDGSWYGIEASDAIDNDDTVAYVNRIARAERLDLFAKVANLSALGLVKVHAKGVIADGSRVFVGSLNWTESSLKANREIGVIVGHRGVAAYYRDIFMDDWRASRLYRVEVEGGRATPRSAPGGGRRLRSLPSGRRVEVTGEFGREGRGPAHLEIALPGRTLGYIPRGAGSPPILNPDEAPMHLGRRVVVEGRVRSAEVEKNGIRLHLGPKRSLVLFILRHHVDRFVRAGINPRTTYTGRLVEVRGVLRDYRGPEITITNPAQIEVLEGR